jgi:hypothetical protein
MYATLALIAALTWLPARAGEAISVRIASDGIAATALVADVTAMRLLVGGPGDFYAEERSQSGSVYWGLPANAPDGAYRYEVFAIIGDVSRNEDRDSTKIYRTTGRMVVSGGQLFAQSRAGLSSARGFRLAVADALNALAEALIVTLMPAAEAADLTASSADPKIFFDDTDTLGNDWELVGVDGAFFLLDTAAGNTVPVDIVSTSNNNSAFTSDANGDISLANDSVFIERSPVRLGLGTITPVHDLHISGNTATIRIDDGGLGVWDIGEFANDLRFTDAIDGIASLTLDGAGGRVGIGTTEPTSVLHVARADGTAQIFVEETTGVTSPRNMFELRNNGPVGFNMFNTDTNQRWRFAAQVDGFRINIADAGDAGPEMIVFQDGAVQMGKNQTQQFFLDTGGNVTIQGTLTELSDVNAKENFLDLEGTEVLAKLAVRHIGPMAQDFHAAFGLGADEKHIAPKDLASVALVGVKALKSALEKEIEVRDTEIAKHKAKIAEQDAKLAEGEAAIAELKERMAALETALNWVLATPGSARLAAADTGQHP